MGLSEAGNRRRSGRRERKVFVWGSEPMDGYFSFCLVPITEIKNARLDSVELGVHHLVRPSPRLSLGPTDTTSDGRAWFSEASPLERSPVLLWLESADAWQLGLPRTSADERL